MEKKWSVLDSILSVLASIATIASIILGFLLSDAKNATVQIEQPGGPLEVRLVDFPDVYSDLKAENERLKAELEQKEKQTVQANTAPAKEALTTDSEIVPKITAFIKVGGPSGEVESKLPLYDTYPENIAATRIYGNRICIYVEGEDCENVKILARCLECSNHRYCSDKETEMEGWYTWDGTGIITFGIPGSGALYSKITN